MTANPFPNAPRRLGRDWHVSQSQARASDANSGAAVRPFKTITRAFALAKPGDRILVGAGVYREEVVMTRNGVTMVPESMLTVEAREGQSVFWKGSDVFPAKWRRRSDGLHEAPLPRALFRKGAYNPYALSGTLGRPGRVRPAKGDQLPETLGQLYIDGHPVRQESGVEAVRRTPNTFVVSADGRSLVVHFPGGAPPVKAMLELTVRRHCLAPLAGQIAMVETRGLVVEHAAEPEPICLGRPVTLRREGAGSLLVRKTRVLPNNIIGCNIIGPMSYRDTEGATLIASVQYPKDIPYGEPHSYYTATSDNAGLTWTPMSGTGQQTASYPSGYFQDTKANRLLRYRFERRTARSKTDWRTMVEISADGGRKWGSPTILDFGVPNCLIRLADGTLFWAAYAQEGGRRGITASGRCVAAGAPAGVPSSGARADGSRSRPRPVT